MPHRRKPVISGIAWLCAMLLSPVIESSLAQQPGRSSPPTTPRDTPAQQQNSPPPPAGRIAGRVLATDNGRPVKRARVFISAAELPGGRGLLTDDKGIFDFSELPPGRYNMTVSKSGFVSLAYGQRRPQQAGTPIQLADGQQIKGIEFRLPRGSVVSGHVYDEDGDAVAGVMVRAMRYEYMQGDRRLVPAGSGQTDDKGQYRIWGLMPGDYYVNAQAQLNLPGFAGRGGRGGPPPAAALAGALGRFGGGNLASLVGGSDEGQKSYASTYFPGVTSITEARPVTLGLSQESLDNDFSLLLTPVSRIGGRVTNPDGSASTSGNVSLQPESALQRGGNFGMNYGGRIQWDGAFSIGNVPPGRYILRARGDDTESPQFASQPITVGGEELPGLTVVLSPGATISGKVVIATAQAQSPDGLRIAAPSLEQQINGGQTQARVDSDGTFTISAVPPGQHLIRPNGGTRSLVLSSVVLDSRDITDLPLDLRSGQKLSNVIVTFTDKVSEINGTITNERGEAVTDYTVLAFSTDNNFWRPQSRHIMTARPDQTGRFRIRGLPRGDYYLVIVDPAQQGEWFDPAYLDEHRLRANRVSLAEGDVKSQNFQVKSGS